MSVVVASSAILPLPAIAADWAVDPVTGTVTFADQVGFNEEGTAFAGTVALRRENVTVSGQFKILTTIVGIIPEPGFTYSVKKAGGVNGTVEITFTSPTKFAKFSFLYKPGLTRIDYGVMRSR